MSRTSYPVLAGILLLSFAAATRAAADPILPGNVLRMTFDLEWYPPPNFPVPLNAFDVLEFHPGVQAVEPVTSYTVRLFDGERLLGSYTGDLTLAYDLGYPPVAAAFKRPTSFFTRGNPTTVDFSTINDGTIQGVVELTIADGELDWRRVTDEFGLEQTYSYRDIAAQATFAATSVEVRPAPVPEPTTLLLVSSGLAAMAWRRGQRTHRSSE